MRKSLLVFMSMCSVLGAEIVKVGDEAAFDEVAGRINFSEPVNILFLGDSLTAQDKGRNHIDKAQRFLDKYNPGRARIFNYAIGGDFIHRTVSRLKGDKKVHKAEDFDDIWSRDYGCVFVFLGHNDTKASSAKDYKTPVVPPERQKALYTELLEMFREKGIKRVVLMSSSSSDFEICKARAEKTAAAGKVHNLFGDPAHMESFNAVLQELAAAEGLEYLDVYTDMKALPNKAELFRDGVHLSDAGHDYIALAVLRHLSGPEK